MGSPGGERVLLCVPRGGLNDSLCQVERCWRYAERYGRRLIVDSSRSGLFLHFGELFEPRQVSIETVLGPTLDLSNLNVLHCVPAGIFGRIDSYEARYARDVGNFVDVQSGERITFDLSRDHDVPLLVHDQCGGGDWSYALIPRVKLAGPVSAIVAEAIERLPGDYVGIHVRNTDYRTAYLPFFSSLKDQLEGRNVLVCSDDMSVIAHARNIFSHARVFTASDIPDVGGRPLHAHSEVHTSDVKRQASLSSMVDLIALALSDELHFVELDNGHVSGFSRLARFLHGDKSLTRRFAFG